ncbi:MAG: hypothetical protein ACM3MN_06550 [Nitrospirota bacterium]
MAKKTLLLVMFAVLLGGCAALQPYIAPPPPDRGQPPRIVEAYASKVIRPGEAWMIFVRAEDPDGDMKSIAAVLWQAGVGYYPTEVNMIKAEDGKRLSGYLFMATPPSFELNWDEFELVLILRDSQLNRSQPVKLPLTFDLTAKQVIPEQWQEAANHLIASLMFQIESSSFYNRGGNSRTGD